MSFPKRRTGIVLVGYGLGLLILGYRTPSPEWLKAAVALMATLIVPGWALATSWPKLRDKDIAVHLALSMPLSLVLVSGVVLADFVLPLGLIRMVSLLFLGTFVLVMMAHKLEGPGRTASRLPAMFWPCAVGVVALCLWGQGPMSPVSDGPDHLSTIGEILKTGELFPHQGVIPPETLDRSDPRKGTLHVALAMAAKAGNIGPTKVWTLFPSVLACSLLAMLFVLGRALFRDVRVALLGAVLTMLCLGGEGARWILHLGYGAHTGMWMAWGALWALFAYLQEKSWSWILLVAVLLVAAEAVHPLAPLFFFLPAVLMMVLELNSGRDVKGLATLLVVSLILVSPILLLRMHEASGPINPLHVTVTPTLVLGRELSVLWPGMILHQLGWLGCLGILLTPVVFKNMRSGWERNFLLAAVTGPLIITLVPGIFDVATKTTSSFPIKSLFVVPAFFVVAKGMFRSRSWAGILGLLSLLACMEALPAFNGKHAKVIRTEGMERTLASLRDIAPSRTVIADPWMSYLIAAETHHYPVTVVGQHGHPLDVRGAIRLGEQNTVLSDGCYGSGIKQVLDFYGDPLVAVPPGDSEFLRGFGASRGGVIDERRRAHLLHLGAVEMAPGVYDLSEASLKGSPELGSRLSFDPPGVKVEERQGAIGVVSVEFPDPFVVEEEVPLVLWWSRVGVWSSIPVEAHIRLESVDFSGRFKPWRKVREALGWVGRTRLRTIQAPFEYSWPPSCWIEGGALADTLMWRIPVDLPEGTYSLQIRVLEQEIMPRIHLRDVLWENDRWQGTVLGTVKVLR